VNAQRRSPTTPPSFGFLGFRGRPEPQKSETQHANLTWSVILMPLSRRDVLRSTAAGGLGIILAGSAGAVAGPAAAQAPCPAGYGPLLPDPRGLLALPKGFSYRIVAEAGVTALESGHPTPGEMRHHEHRGRTHRGQDPRVRQPRGHGRELRGRRDAVAHVADLRGDRTARG
jgi:hypothetical protein